MNICGSVLVTFWNLKVPSCKRCILGISMPNMSELKEDVVIISRDIPPSITGSMDLDHVAGMVMEGGGRTFPTRRYLPELWKFRLW